MTHQDVIDRMEGLNREHSKAYEIECARIRKEKESLQELCGGLGHFFKDDAEWPLNLSGRRCVFCGKPESKA